MALLCGVALTPYPAPNSIAGTAVLASRAAAHVADAVPKVWLVDAGDGYELYSNGLRIETGFTVSNVARKARVAGIVYHETESHQASFEPSETGSLTRIGRELLEFVRRNHSYNYLVDRFGRVWRIVPESDVAYHAGRSVWADSQGSYVNLNSNFLGVAVESAGGAPPTEGQIHALRTLTEWLRRRHGIQAGNCVTHAQVSVNPDNMRIGYHSDWAAGFPFAGAGLPDNYRVPLPAVLDFGFGYDAALVRAAGGHVWPGIERAEEELRLEAARWHTGETQLRQQLQQRYRRILNLQQGDNR